MVFVRSLSFSSRVFGLRGSSATSTTWSAPLFTCSSSSRTALQISSSLSVLGFVAHLAPSCLHLAYVLWDLMDLLGSVRRDGLSALSSLPLCRFPPPPPCRGSSCRVFPLVQAKLVSPFLWFTAVPYMLLVSPEGVFFVTNCMLTLPGTLARVFLVTTDGFSFFGPEPSHLGSLARVMIRLYTQDPSCTLFCLVVRSPFACSVAPSPRFTFFNRHFELRTDGVATNRCCFNPSLDIHCQSVTCRCLYTSVPLLIVQLTPWRLDA